MKFQRVNLGAYRDAAAARAKGLGAEATLVSTVDLRRQKLLLIGAHPDDITLAMSSLAFLEFHARTVITLTHGKEEDERCKPAIAEALLACADELFLGDAPDGKGPPEEQNEVTQFFRLLQAIKPTVVATHHPIDHHPAHRATERLVRSAIDYMPIEDRPALLHSRPPARYDSSRFHPNLFVVLNEPLARLLADAIRLHPTEMRKGFYCPKDRLEMLEGMASYHLRPYGRGSARWADGFEVDALKG